MPIDRGPQPLDLLMEELKILAADLVGASTQQLTFKAVQKGRKGKQLTPVMQNKILNALRALKPERNFGMSDVFNY